MIEGEEAFSMPTSCKDCRIATQWKGFLCVHFYLLHLVCAPIIAAGFHPKSTKHSRKGRKTSMYCQACKVSLCDECFWTFHTSNPTIPPCCSKLDRSRRTRSSTSGPIRTSPTKVTRKKRTHAPRSSPRAAITAALREHEISSQTEEPREISSQTSPSSLSPPKTRRRTVDSPDESDDERRVRPRVLYPPTGDNDLSSPPREDSGWSVRSIFSWKRKWYDTNAYYYLLCMLLLEFMQSEV